MLSVWPLSVVKTAMIASVPSTTVSFVVREMAMFLEMEAGLACTIPKTERATSAIREMNIERSRWLKRKWEVLDYFLLFCFDTFIHLAPGLLGCMTNRRQ